MHLNYKCLFGEYVKENTEWHSDTTKKCTCNIQHYPGRKRFLSSLMVKFFKESKQENVVKNQDFDEWECGGG